MGTTQFPLIAWAIFLTAALLEVGGDLVIRKGLKSGTWTSIVFGCAMLAAYGLVVNLVKWDFSKLLGVYVAVFAVVSVMAGRILFRETIAPATWVGLGMIVAGGLAIQYGQR